MLNSIFKKGLTILSIALIVLIVAQIAMMFFPYFEVKPIASRRDEETVLTQFSMQEYTWTDTETITKVFVERDRDAEYDRINAIIENGQVEENWEDISRRYDEKAQEKILAGKKVTKKNVENALMVDINDDLVDLALVNAFALIAIIMIIMELKHQFSKYRLASRVAWVVLSHLLVLVWSIFTVFVFTSTCPVLDEGINQTIRSVITYMAIGGIALEVLRLVCAFMTRTRYKKVEVKY